MTYNMFHTHLYHKLYSQVIQSQVICDLYLIFNSNWLSSNIKGLINELYMDFRQNIKIYQPQIPNPKYFPQIPNPK